MWVEHSLSIYYYSSFEFAINFVYIFPKNNFHTLCCCKIFCRLCEYSVYSTNTSENGQKSIEFIKVAEQHV